MDYFGLISCWKHVSRSDSFHIGQGLYWNTLKINDIVEELKKQGEEIDDETLSHISLLPYKHVLPNGTYFIED